MPLFWIVPELRYFFVQPVAVDTVNGKATTMADYFTSITKDPNKKERLSARDLRLSKVSFPAHQSRSSFSYLQDSVLMNIYLSITKNNLAVGKPDKKLNLYEISVSSPEERFT